jgi:hypothetical protein
MHWIARPPFNVTQHVSRVKDLSVHLSLSPWSAGTDAAIEMQQRDQRKFNKWVLLLGGC